jgi:ABC-type polysaccharide/polyol phosphate transport system ATPase subunit
VSGPAIRLDDVSKRYVKLDEQAMLLKSLLPFRRPKRSDLWALRHVGFEVADGETIGVLGRNGAGKSTLLRMLAGVTQPTEGSIRVAGRIAPLISVGVGFHKEMSGRENVLVNGMLLGLTPADIKERFDDIVAFAELDEFIDTPVKFYSSGMFMRLGFSVAVHSQPDVLLVDEVLAVGDLAFQFKCFDRRRELQARGTTIVIVSHSVTAIQLLCPRAIVMRRGELVFDGPAMEAVAKHYELLSEQADDHAAGDTTGGARVVARELRSEGVATTTLRQHTPVQLRATVRFDRDVESPQVAFTVMASTGSVAYQLLPKYGSDYRSVRAGEELEVVVDWMCRLAGGTYQILIKVTDRDGRETLYVDGAGTLVYVEPRLGSVGIAELDAVAFVDGVDISDHEAVVLEGSPPPLT